MEGEERRKKGPSAHATRLLDLAQSDPGAALGHLSDLPPLLTAPDPTVRAQATSVLVELSIHHPLELRSTSEAILARLDDVVAAPIEQRKLRTRLEDLLDHRRRFGQLARRNRLIEALHGATQRMDGATDAERVCEIAVDTAHSALDLPFTAIWLADETNEQLYPVA